jgi:hypothetical protein
MHLDLTPLEYLRRVRLGHAPRLTARLEIFLGRGVDCGPARS